jgi:multidrug efflux pump subunit AcrB
MIRWLARLAVDNAVAVNLGTLAVALAGLIAYARMPREVFPEFTLGTVTVRTVYPGAAPEDMERLVTLPLEEELSGLDGLKEMTSTSGEGLSTITLDLLAETDPQRFLEEVRTAVTGDVTLPEEAEEPLVREVRSEFPVIAVFLHGSAPEEEMRLEAERHQRALERIGGVSQVILSGVREPRVWVEVDPLSLERYGLTLRGLGEAVGARATDAPLGSLSTASGDYLLRVESGVQGADDLRALPVLFRTDGTVVRLGEVARVRDTYERRVTLARFNGEPALHLQVNKRESGDLIDIAREVRTYVAENRDLCAPGLTLAYNSDLSVYVENRLRVMRESGFLGGMLVLVSLVMFLAPRIAFWTAIGIPLSFLGGLLLAYSVGISMNMMTMFALIVVLGMVVDDAIVVGENVFRKIEEGLPPVQAAVEGTVEVGKPVTATILTTIAAFLPMLMITGVMGKFMRPLPLIITFCLLASLVEALLVLPSHLAHFGRSGGSTTAVPGAPRRRWYDPLRDMYVRHLRFALRWRYVSLAAAVMVTGLTVGYAVHRVPFTLFDDFESKVFYVNLRAPADTPMERTAELAGGVEDEVRELPASELESTNLLAGVSYQDRERGTSEIIEELRERFAIPPAGLESVDIDQPQAGPTGKAIDVSLRGPDSEVLVGLADELAVQLAAAAGVRDIRDDAEPGKREVRIRLNDHGRLLGLTEAGVAAELRSAFEGTSFASLRRGRDDVEVAVKYPEELRGERGFLRSVRVTAPSGARVPLGSVATLDEVSGQAVISRDDGERSVRVTADVNKAEGNSTRILADVQAWWAERSRGLAGYSLALKGDYQDTVESMRGLQVSVILALAVMYMILGSLFRSATQPLVIMFAIPLAATGMILGHLVMGRILSFMSLIGGLALAGIVVNDSLILVDFVNTRRRAGMPLMEALVEAGRLRFRPILLTSITTMLGLSPLTFFASGQARFLQPMAISIFFGLLAATVLILVLVPCAYAVLEDVHALARRSGRRSEPAGGTLAQESGATP